LAKLAQLEKIPKTDTGEPGGNQRNQVEQKVSVFGARLDDDIAGEVDIDRGRFAQDQHQKDFELGNKLMLRGEYKAAVSAFTQAIVNAPGGLAGRKGGQYAVYLAQALQAASRKQEAVKLLQRCDSHSDADVRKISQSVLYIMQAPELKLGQENFVSIPALDLTDDWGPRRKMIEKKDPPPEKYSLEWYVLEAEKRKNRSVESQPASTTGTILASGLVLAATFAFVFTR